MKVSVVSDVNLESTQLFAAKCGLLEWKSVKLHEAKLLKEKQRVKEKLGLCTCFSND